MLRQERHDDVTRLTFESWWSRSMGFSVSTYAVRGVLVDTAFHDVRADLGAWIGANKPDGAIVTHYHEDHAGNVEFLAARGVPLWIAPATLAKVRSSVARGDPHAGPLERAPHRVGRRARDGVRRRPLSRSEGSRDAPVAARGRARADRIDTQGGCAQAQAIFRRTPRTRARRRRAAHGKGRLDG